MLTNQPPVGFLYSPFLVIGVTRFIIIRGCTRFGLEILTSCLYSPRLFGLPGQQLSSAAVSLQKTSILHFYSNSFTLCKYFPHLSEWEWALHARDSASFSGFRKKNHQHWNLSISNDEAKWTDWSLSDWSKGSSSARTLEGHFVSWWNWCIFIFCFKILKLKISLFPRLSSVFVWVSSGIFRVFIWFIYCWTLCRDRRGTKLIGFSVLSPSTQ